MKDYKEEIRETKVLVTGGLGFVGHNLVKTLVNKYNCDVIVVDDCSNSKPEILGETINQVTFHKMSVMNAEQLFPLIEQVDYVFHLACKQISASGSDPLVDLQVNAQSTLQMLSLIHI